VARNDYAGNSNGYVQGMNTFQPTMNYPDCVYLGFGTKANTTASLLWRDTTDDRGKYPTNNPYYGPACGKGGIFFSYSMVAIDDIHDGTSNTICVGEKYLRPDFYENGAAHGDCWSCWIGYDTCNGRCVERRNVPVPAVRDTWGYYVAGAFGSPHAGGCNYVMCDGSVRQISYGCDGQVFMNLGNRNDGNQIDPAGLSM
jgi:prepilin-type processing-associated H-X9-DG protein